MPDGERLQKLQGSSLVFRKNLRNRISGKSKGGGLFPAVEIIAHQPLQEERQC